MHTGPTIQRPSNTCNAYCPLPLQYLYMRHQPIFSPPTFPLQYLYMRHLRTCYLFRSCPQRFLDALLASARVEVFMPGEL